MFTVLLQLSDAISIIGREDFPMKWPDLLTEMVTRFQSGDFHIINGVLRTAHSLFKRLITMGMTRGPLMIGVIVNYVFVVSF